MRSTRTSFLLVLLAAGCGSGSGGDDPMADAAPGDQTAPELRDVRVEIDGPLGVNAELNTADGEHVLPGEASAELTVIARDDTDPVDALVVDAVDAGGEDAQVTGSELRNGVWRVQVAVAPGDELRARVIDSSGNEALADHVLRVPPLDEAVVDSWEIWFFDQTETVTHKWLVDWQAGGWTETRQDTSTERSGTWSLEGDVARVTDSDTGERRDGRLHVDALYMALDPWHRTAGDSGPTGTWERSWSIYEPGGGGSPDLAEEVSQTLTMAGGDWTESTTVTDHRGASPDETTSTRAGTYRVEINENYSEAVGDFLVRAVTSVDGSQVTEDETWDLHVVRGEALLIRPMLRLD